MSRIIVFDGNSILNRAYYGIRPLSTGDGVPTNAVFGFINIILKNLSLCGGADYGVAAFDLKAPTFRHKLFDGYKANRKGMPDELAVQLPFAKQAAEYLGLAVLEKEGYEADDVLGTVSALAEDRGVECILVTGDRDSLQLVSAGTTVYLAATNETKIFNLSAFKEKYGIDPQAFVDVKALMGDSSDNIPGVRGIGEKGALKLIAEYGSLEGVYAAADQIKGSMGEKLRAGKESAYLCRTLSRIVRDVPLDLTLESLKINRRDGELYALCKRLELNTLADRLGLKSEEEKIEKVEEKPFAEAGGEEAAGLYANADRVYLYHRDGVLYVTDGAGLNTRLLPDGGTATFFKSIEGKGVFWCYKDTAKAFASVCDVAPPKDDISLLAYVVNPVEGGQSTPSRTARMLGLFDGSESAEAETLILPSLESALKERASAAGQMQLYRNIELKLARLLLEMEKAGFEVNREGLLEFSSYLSARMSEAESAIYALAGEEFNINSPMQLSVVLYEKLGLPHFRKTQRGYSTDAEALQKLRRYHPIVDLILSYRQFAKLKNTYADGLVKVISESDGRIHSTFNQTLTMTGRLSSSEPNLQNIPVRTELGKIFRRFFVPKSGSLLVDADYSQIELRVLAHVSGDPMLISAFRDGADVHAATASQVFGVPLDSVTPELRKRAKAVNFGIIYGISAFSLAEDIGVSRKMAQDYIEAYFRKYPKIRDYMDQTVRKAKETGYVSTLFGRIRYVPELKAKNRNLVAFGERVAMNTPIQGTAADIIKKAMVDTDAALKAAGMKARLILQIHDELIVEAPEDEAEAAAALLKEKMENTVKLLVPLVADAHVGKSWFDAK